MIDVHFDMETADPDDVFTLCFLTSHPLINLCSVSITPGSDDQVGLVKRVLEITEKKDVPVGANGYDKSCVSAFHNKYLKWKPIQPDTDAADLIRTSICNNPNIVLLTGAPLKNIHSFIDQEQIMSEEYELPTINVNRWVAQGGFAGDSIVPPEHRLAKFAGRETCPTFNFNGDVEGAKKALSSSIFNKRELVSKNVCHGVSYDRNVHEFMSQHKHKTPGLELMWKGMDIYLGKKPNGKLFHDPLAAAVVVDSTICEFVEVDVYRNKGEWGSRKSSDTNTFISISVDKQKLFEVLSTT